VVKTSDAHSSLYGCVQAPVLSLDIRPTVAGEGEEPALVLLATCMDGVHAIVHVNVEDGGMLKMDIVHRAKVRLIRKQGRAGWSMPASPPGPCDLSFSAQSQWILVPRI
jgi:hypothetical protein